MIAPIISSRLKVSLAALGAVGSRWLADLPDLLDGFETDWSIRCGRALDGGNAAYVTEVVTGEGRPAVLKVAIPAGIEAFDTFDQELEVLCLAGGDPYVEVIRHDKARRGFLLERLGRPLAGLGWSINRQLGVITSTVARGWRPVVTDRLPTGATKARWLAEFVMAAWEALDQPCQAATVERAVHYADERAAAFRPDRAVLIHGDAHPHNLLQWPGPGRRAAGFRLIDPEGLLSEPAHDLGVALRNWNAELLGGDPVDVALERVRRAARLTGVDGEAIWQWSFVERVSTGLFLLRLGHRVDAQAYLAAADLLAHAAPTSS